MIVNMPDSIQKLIDFELAHDFSFLDLPNKVAEYIWRNGNGVDIDMDSMKLDHLKACINLVKRSLANLDEKIIPGEVKEALRHEAEEKLAELTTKFEQKSKL